MSADAAGLYRLMAWLSPSYPVGAYTLSHGLEQVVEDAAVTDAASLADWVADVLLHGAGRQDAILLAAAYRARRHEASRSSSEPDPTSAHSHDGSAAEPSTPAHSGASRNPGPHDGPWSNPPWIPASAGMSGVKGNDGGEIKGRGEAPSGTPALADIVALAAALNPSKERRTETLSQGEAFRVITETAWPSPIREKGAPVFRPDGQDDGDPASESLVNPAARPWPEGPLAYPVAVAIAAADHGVPLAPTLTAYLHGFSANIVSAGVRLIPLGQSDGQRTIARLERVIGEIAEAAESASLDDLGGCALLADIASMRHETQYTRLFRT